MQLTVATWDDRVVVVDIDVNDPVETLKAILEVETGVPIAEQQLNFQGQSLQNGTNLAAAGVGNGDLIMLSRAQAGGEYSCHPSLGATVAWYPASCSCNMHEHTELQSIVIRIVFP